MILINTIFIGWQIQWLADRAEQHLRRNESLPMDEPVILFVMQFIFCVFFTTELGMRWIAEGCRDFFYSNDMWWNILDVVIVVFGLIDIVVDMLVRASAWTSADAAKFFDAISVLRGLRVMRIVRMARVIRVMKYFRELRIMIFSILGSLKSLTWVVVVVGMVFYIFGVAFVGAVLGHWETLESGNNGKEPSFILEQESSKDLSEYFGTLDRAMLSLYMSMSGGEDWRIFYNALAPLPPHYKGLYLLFITISVFAVINIVTGVFVEHAMQSSALDREVVVNEELQTKKNYLKNMREVFEEMDEDDSGCISAEEFETRLNDERVIAYFNAMKLDVSDARALFRLMDYDQSGEVSIGEFLDSCYRLQGESRRIDMKMMEMELRYLQESFRSFKEAVDMAWSGKLRRLQSDHIEKESAHFKKLIAAEETKEMATQVTPSNALQRVDSGKLMRSFSNGFSSILPK
jgi:Ca2+-binding EF-hand superfamily protein